MNEQSQFAVDITSLIGLFGGGTVLAVAVAAWLSHLMTERVLSKWRREEPSQRARNFSKLKIHRFTK